MQIRILVRSLTLVLLIAAAHESFGQSVETTSVSNAESGFVSSPVGYLNDLIVELKKEWPTNRSVRIVFHGHSVPAGYFKTPKIQRFDSYPILVQQKLCELFPTAPIDVSITAIGGENSPSGAERFERDVISLSPDLVFIDYSLNDRRAGLEKSAAAWAKMIERCQSEGIRVVLMTPTPDLREDITSDDVPLLHHSRQLRGLSDSYKIPIVDSYAAFRSRVAAGSKVTDFLSQVNHPNRKGHEIVADLILELFEKTKTD